MSLPQQAVPGLPIPLTPMIGRRREVEEVVALLRDDGVRLLTLIGSGGVGKTRLAAAVATVVADDFADGVVGVPLGAITDPSLAISSIAQALGIREEQDQPLARQIAMVLSQKRLLLLLDGLEGVAHDGALLTALLNDCPRLKILVTSRVVLHLSAEHLFDVLPLTHTPGEAETADSSGCADAVELFVQRARAAGSSFRLTAENAPVVEEICRRLDGLPLAIELAAARVRYYSPESLLDRLERRLPLLGEGPRDAPSHQRTLAATIAWSYELLGAAERGLLRSISMFAGGCSLDAALEVGQATETDLLTLVDHSLLRRFDLHGVEPRFSMLDTVREFALERLAEAGEWEAARRRHVGWCLALLAPAEAALGTRSQQQWLRPIEMEHANLRVAMEMAKTVGDGEALARLASGLWSFWYARGFLTEGRVWLSDALSLSNEMSELRPKLLLGSGALAHAQGDNDAARTTLEQAVAQIRLEGDARTMSMSLTLLGAAERDHGDYERSGELLDESLQCARSAHDTWATGMALNALAVLHERRGEFDRAAAILQESASLAEVSKDIWGKVHAVSNMAHLSHRQGDFERAAALYEQGANLYRQIGDKRGEANALTNLGRIAERQGDLDRAVELHTRSLEMARELGDIRGTATSLANRGVAHLRRGDLRQARDDLRQSLGIRAEARDPEGVATSLEKLAEVSVARGQARHAIRLWAAAAGVRDAIGAPLAPSERASYDVVLYAARAMVGEAEVASAWAQGRADPLDVVVQAALHADDASDASAPAAPKGTATLPAGLTARELDVLRLLEQHTDRAIAEALSIGPRTVATHVTSILNKLGVNTRTAAVASAIRHGLI